MARPDMVPLLDLAVMLCSSKPWLCTPPSLSALPGLHSGCRSSVLTVGKPEYALLLWTHLTRSSEQTMR